MSGLRRKKKKKTLEILKNSTEAMKKCRAYTENVGIQIKLELEDKIVACCSELLEDWGKTPSLTACSINLEREMAKTLLLDC